MNLKFLIKYGLRPGNGENKKEKHSCSICKKTLSGKNSLENHMKSFHGDDKDKKKCALCDYRYHHKINLKSVNLENYFQSKYQKIGSTRCKEYILSL